jgi:hypothetical protein
MVKTGVATGWRPGRNRQGTSPPLGQEVARNSGKLGEEAARN